MTDTREPMGFASDRCARGDRETPRRTPLRPKLANLLEWDDVDRCRLLIVLTVPYFAAYALRASYLVAHPNLEPYYDPRTLLWMRDGLAAVCGFWILFLAGGSLERRRPGPHTGYLWVGTLSWWLGICGVAYALGPITSPAWIALVIGGVSNLLLLPLGIALAGTGLGMALTVAGIALSTSGWIPYAPAHSESPVVALRLPLSYAIGNTLASLSATFFVIGIVAYLATRWRTLVAHLRGLNENLAVTITERTRELARRRQAEAALSASEERYRLLAENAGDIVAELDDIGRYAYVSPNYQAVLGYRASDLLGTSPVEWIHPDHSAEIAAVIQRIVATGTPETKRYQFRHRAGEWRWIESYAKSFVNSQDETHIVVISQDITERRRAEERRAELEARMQQTQKLENLGVLAGGIAHDFNNLLLPILGNARLAKAELAPDAPALRFIARAETAAVRAAELTDTLLAYAGKRRVTAQSLQLFQILEETVELLRSTLPQQVALRLEAPRSLPLIRGDPAQIRQIALNLITNASEAIGNQRGLITVSAGMLVADHAYLRETDLGTNLSAGSYVYLDVQDTGCGMDAETKAKIFDPFFTTKFAGRGLGLAALLGILRAHHGALLVESALKRGTRFRLLFPLVAASQAKAPADPRARSEWRGSGTVLVVDDEEAVRELLEEVVPRAGMAVLSAKNGREAVARFREAASKITIVLLDLTMPEMGGLEAFREIRKIRPDARVILSSGYSDVDLTEHLAGETINAFLQKPYTPEELVETLQRVSERAGTGALIE